MLIDTHAHLDFKDFNEDLDEVIKRCYENDILVINVGVNYKSSKRVVELAEKNEGLFATIGLHSGELDTGLVKNKRDLDEKEFDYNKYRELCLSSKKIVAIGEIGLDYWYKPKTKIKIAKFKEKQRKLLLDQIKLSQEFNLPIIFHCRVAHNDLIEILEGFQSFPCPRDRGSNGFQAVVHSFTGNWEQAEKFLDMGLYLGFNGLIFSKVAEELNFKETIKKTPLNRILIETDSPFLVPPQAKVTRNEPVFVKYVAQRIAEIKGVSFEKVAETTSQNAKELFKLIKL